MTQRSVRMPYVLAALALALIGVAACESGDNGPTPPPSGDEAQIRATARVDGSGRSGVSVRLFNAGGASAISTQTTGNNGSALFDDLDAGDYDVEVIPPDGLILADGEDDRKGVTANANQTAEVTFDLAEDPTAEILEVTVNDNNTFSPANPTIEPGTTVRWIATGSMVHTITPDGHSEWSEGSVAGAGDTFTHTFGEDTSGETFDYFCSPHLSFGMVGSITVQ